MSSSPNVGFGLFCIFTAQLYHHGGCVQLLWLHYMQHTSSDVQHRTINGFAPDFGRLPRANQMQGPDERTRFSTNKFACFVSRKRPPTALRVSMWGCQNHRLARKMIAKALSRSHTRHWKSLISNAYYRFRSGPRGEKGFFASLARYSFITAL